MILKFHATSKAHRQVGDSMSPITLLFKNSGSLAPAMSLMHSCAGRHLPRDPWPRKSGCLISRCRSLRQAPWRRWCGDIQVSLTWAGPEVTPWPTHAVVWLSCQRRSSIRNECHDCNGDIGTQEHIFKKTLGFRRKRKDRRRGEARRGKEKGEKRKENGKKRSDSAEMRSKEGLGRRTWTLQGTPIPSADVCEIIIDTNYVKQGEWTL